MGNGPSRDPTRQGFRDNAAITSSPKTLTEEFVPGPEKPMGRACRNIASCQTVLGQGGWATAKACGSPISQFVLRESLHQSLSPKEAEQAAENTRKMLEFAKKTDCEDQWGFPCNYFLRYHLCELDAAGHSKMLTWRRGVADSDYFFQKRIWEYATEQRDKLRASFWVQLREITEFLEEKELHLLDFKLDNLLCVPEQGRDSFRVLVIDLDQWIQTDVDFDPEEEVNGEKQVRVYGSRFFWVPADFLPVVPASSPLFEMWRLCLSLTSIAEFCYCLYSKVPEGQRSDSTKYESHYLGCQISAQLAVASKAVTFLWFLHDYWYGSPELDFLKNYYDEQLGRSRSRRNYLIKTDNEVTLGLQRKLEECYGKLLFRTDFEPTKDDEAIGSNISYPRAEERLAKVAENAPILRLDDEAMAQIAEAISNLKLELQRFESPDNLSSAFSGNLVEPTPRPRL
jgi:hypothetical protein